MHASLSSSAAAAAGDLKKQPANLPLIRQMTPELSTNDRQTSPAF